MAVHKTEAVVIGRRALGESDRLVEFYTREFGKVRGVAKAARRMRSRFGSSLEPFTLGALIFFDTGRSELVRELRRTAGGDVDLVALEVSARPAWVVTCFAMRAVDFLGHRPRIDRCTGCGRLYPFGHAVLDVTAGGLICGRCEAGADAIPLSGGVVGTLKRLRGLRWEELLRLPLAQSLESELCSVVEGLIARLAGQIPHSSRFLAQMGRALARVAEPGPPSRRR